MAVVMSDAEQQAENLYLHVVSCRQTTRLPAHRNFLLTLLVLIVTLLSLCRLCQGNVCSCIFVEYLKNKWSEVARKILQLVFTARCYEKRGYATVNELSLVCPSVSV